MATFVMLTKYTGNGIRDIKSSPDRIKSARAAIESAGGKLVSYLVTMGQYDGVAIAEFPNDETAAVLALATASQGNVSTETMRAFTEPEFTAIVGKLP